MDPTNIKLLLTDVDGVMTDGSIVIHTDGSESKRFFVRDGSAIVAWRKCGFPIGIITGRPSVVTTHRAKELGVDYVEQCQAMGKVESYEDICKRAGVEDGEVAYIGDDLADLPVLTRVGYPIAVADACEEVRDVAKLVTTKPGGHGAVREAIEHLLKSMGKWEEVLDRYGV